MFRLDGQPVIVFMDIKLEIDPLVHITMRMDAGMTLVYDKYQELQVVVVIVAPLPSGDGGDCGDGGEGGDEGGWDDDDGGGEGG